MSQTKPELTRINSLQATYDDFCAALSTCSTEAALADLKASLIGGKGTITQLMKGLKDLPLEERREFGVKANEIKDLIEEKSRTRLAEFRRQEALRAVEASWIDPSLRESNVTGGLNAAGFHPLTLVQREVEDVFLGMGFQILDGPHVETDYYNFEALNIPRDHPARDMQDTFWFPDLEHLLRTHTSAVQARGMQLYRPPFKFIAPGKCFRCERTDASHEMMFHQVEGMMVDRGVSVAHLTYFMNVILNHIFGRSVKVRLRPGFFPFVEPGFELDINCLICSGAGCSVCKHSGWVELLPCGMIHPAVLRTGNIDPTEYSGFAFGLGLDRLLMMRYGINDIRLIHSGDLRLSLQFKTF